jgi:translation initiation factor 1
MAKKNKPESSGLVYSTNPEFQWNNEGHEQDTLPPGQQKLIVSRSSKGRGGKTVTLVNGFVGREADLETLGKMLKNKCGTGGSVKDGEIIIQGEVRQKVAEALKAAGYAVKVSG